MKKMHFAGEGFAGSFSESGEYEAPFESSLPHRFELKDGKVVDKYNGISDEQVQVQDHINAIHTALNWTDHEGNPAPLTPPPPLGWVAPDDHKPGDPVPEATLAEPSLDPEHNKFAATLTPEFTATPAAAVAGGK